VDFIEGVKKLANQYADHLVDTTHGTENTVEDKRK